MVPCSKHAPILDDWDGTLKLFLSFTTWTLDNLLSLFLELYRLEVSPWSVFCTARHSTLRSHFATVHECDGIPGWLLSFSTQTLMTFFIITLVDVVFRVCLAHGLQVVSRAMLEEDVLASSC